MDGHLLSRKLAFHATEERSRDPVVGLFLEEDERVLDNVIDMYC